MASKSCRFGYFYFYDCAYSETCSDSCSCFYCDSYFFIFSSSDQHLMSIPFSSSLILTCPSNELFHCNQKCLDSNFIWLARDFFGPFSLLAYQKYFMCALWARHSCQHIFWQPSLSKFFTFENLSTICLSLASTSSLNSIRSWNLTYYFVDTLSFDVFRIGFPGDALEETRLFKVCLIL